MPKITQLMSNQAEPKRQCSELLGGCLLFRHPYKRTPDKTCWPLPRWSVPEAEPLLSSSTAQGPHVCGITDSIPPSYILPKQVVLWGCGQGGGGESPPSSTPVQVPSGPCGPLAKQGPNCALKLAEAQGHRAPPRQTGTAAFCPHWALGPSCTFLHLPAQQLPPPIQQLLGVLVEPWSSPP